MSANSAATVILAAALAAWAQGGVAGRAVAQPAPPAPGPQLDGASQVVIPQARAFPLDGRFPPVPGRVEVESVTAQVAILDQTAGTTLNIALRNRGGGPEEAVLLLPVPPGAVVTAFDFQGPASEPTARLLGADEARSLYDSIVAKVRDPALLEFAGWSLVRSSVFPVPAGGTQMIRIAYENLLDADGPRLDYVLPRSESLQRRAPWRIDVSLKSSVPISTVYSPSHEVDAVRLRPGEFSLHLAPRTAAEPGPFRLSYLLEADGVTASLMAYPDPEIGGGYFLFMAGPPARPDQAGERPAREVTIVIDRSGSMAGPKLDQARAAAAQVIEGLADGEAFNIIDYATGVSAMAAAPVVKDADRTRQARRYLASLRAGGGTNLHDALVETLGQPAAADRLPIVLLLSDGLPTIGPTSEIQIRRLVEQGNPARRRVFTFGVGPDVNVPLLDRLADATRATATYVLPGEDVEVKVAGVFKRMAGPVLAWPRLAAVDAGVNRVAELIPPAGQLPDLFEGDRLIVLGQYRGDDPITLRLGGDLLGQPRSFQYTFSLDRATTRNAFVPRLWASRRIARLAEAIRQAPGATARPGPQGAAWLGETRYRELTDEIVRLSTKFGVLTEYTSFLATEGTDLADFDALVLGCRNELETKAAGTRSGTAALGQGINFNRRKTQTSLNYENSYFDDRMQRVEFSNVQQICDLAFFRRGNRWIDSRLIDVYQWITPHEVLVLGSPAHLELLRHLVAEGRPGVLSLAGEILLEVDGRVVLVKDGC